MVELCRTLLQPIRPTTDAPHGVHGTERNTSYVQLWRWVRGAKPVPDERSGQTLTSRIALLGLVIERDSARVRSRRTRSNHLHVVDWTFRAGPLLWAWGFALGACSKGIPKLATVLLLETIKDGEAP